MTYDIVEVRMNIYLAMSEMVQGVGGFDFEILSNSHGVNCIKVLYSGQLCLEVRVGDGEFIKIYPIGPDGSLRLLADLATHEKQALVCAKHHLRCFLRKKLGLTSATLKLRKLGINVAQLPF